MLYRLWIFAVLISSPSAATAGFFSGNEMLTDCSVRPSFVTGYVTGVVDGRGLSGSKAINADNVCIPYEVEAGQLRDIFCKFLVENPAVRHYSASSLLTLALKNPYECQ